ncbi:MAG: phage tail protein [Halobacteriota archaeon]
MEFEFFATTSAAGWIGWTRDNTSDSLADGVRIRQDPVPAYPSCDLVYALGVGLPQGAEINDAALDECGTLYIALSVPRNGASNAIVYKYDCERSVLAPVWPCRWEHADTQSEHLTGPLCLAFARNNVYVLDGWQGRLYCLSRYTFQTRWTLTDNSFKGTQEGSRLRMAVDDASNVYVLNSTSAETNKLQIMKIPPTGENIVYIDSAPRDEAGLLISNGDSILQLDIAVDVEGNPYVLHRVADRYHYITRLSRSRGYFAELYVPAMDFRDYVFNRDIVPSCLTIDNDWLFVGEPSSSDMIGGSRLCRYDRQRRAFAPILSYRSSVAKLITDVQGDLYVIDDDRTNIYFLKRTSKNNLADDSTYSARLHKRFDSGRKGTRWHRLKADFAPAGPGTMIKALYYATDDEELGAYAVPWHELPPNPLDALFENDEQQASGRFLWLRFSIIGTEFESPVLRAVRVYFPFTSYLRYLPAIYSDDTSSRQFLERFLPLFESVFVDIEDVIENLARTFDPCGAEGSYLSWLASWLAIAANEVWSDWKRRELIASAAELYKARGTREGMLHLMELYLSDYLPPIGDPRRYLWVVEASTIDKMREGELKTEYGRLWGRPSCFAVIAGTGLSDEVIAAARNIVRAETPVHANGQFIGLRAEMVLGGHTYLGVNTTLSRRSFVLGTSLLSRDTALVQREQSGQLGIKSRVNVDSVLS